jgi:hypothetical protein
MIEAFCSWAWRLVRKDGKKFFRGVFLVCTLVMLLFSILIFFLFLDTLGLSFQDYWTACLLFALIGAASGALFAFLIRRLVMKGMFRALGKFENLRRGALQQMLMFVERMNYNALEDRLIRELGELRGDQLSMEREYLYAQARYPWHTPPMLLDRILADENSPQIRGRKKESVFVLLSLPGLSAHSLNPDHAGVLVRKVLMSALSFARSSGMLLVQFSLESSVFVADIPYAASKSLRKRLPSLCRKWREQVFNTLADIEEREIVPSCFLHYADLAYGRMQSDARSIFAVDPQAWQGLSFTARTYTLQNGVRPGGVFISRQYAEFANIDCSNPDIAASIAEDWYSLR